MRLPHLAARAFGTPLAILPSKAEVIANAVLLPKLRGDAFDCDDGQEPPAASRVGKIAVLPVRGTLVRRTGGMDAMSGLQSYDTVRGMLRAALADQGVAGILLDVDSPGGEVAGLADLADEILAARDVKPVYAVADDMACSAAYWLACSAERLFLTQTGVVGSVGVICLHLDQSKADAQAGLAYTAIYAGSHKDDFDPHAPLSDDARARAQAAVDETYGMFVAAVAARRPRLGAEAIRATEALTFSGQAAVAAGLADKVGTLDDAAAALGRRIDASTRPGGARGSRATAPSTEETIMAKDALHGAPDQGAAPPTAAVAPPVEPTAAAAPAPEPRTEPRTDPTPAPAAASQPPAAVAADVIDLDKIRKEAKAEATAAVLADMQARADEIVEVCELAGVPHLAGEMIAAGKPVAQVRKDLLVRKADASDARQVNALHGGRAADEAMKAQNYGWDSIVAAAVPAPRQSARGAR